MTLMHSPRFNLFPPPRTQNRGKKPAHIETYKYKGWHILRLTWKALQKYYGKRAIFYREELKANGELRDDVLKTKVINKFGRKR